MVRNDGAAPSAPVWKTGALANVKRISLIGAPPQNRTVLSSLQNWCIATMLPGLMVGDEGNAPSPDSYQKSVLLLY